MSRVVKTANLIEQKKLGLYLTYNIISCSKERFAGAATHRPRPLTLLEHTSGTTHFAHSIGSRPI